MSIRRALYVCFLCVFLFVCFFFGGGGVSDDEQQTFSIFFRCHRFLYEHQTVPYF